MVFSYYLIRPFYSCAWRAVRLFRKKPVCILYCDDAFDAVLFTNVQKHLKKIPLVAKNRKVRDALKAIGFDSKYMPAFPDLVIMFRNMAWKFPCKKIIRIGFEHGAYNFKRFSKAAYYNLFTIFFMTSSHDVERVKKLGVTTAEAIGFPKIDAAFDGSITSQTLEKLSTTIGLDPKKKTVLFSATWDGSGMSAVHLWYDRVGELAERCNLLVTLHPWVSDKYRTVLAEKTGFFFINDDQLLPYIMLADICIGDTNSLIAEFCLLDKPIITFRIPPTPRTMPDVIEMIERVSLRIDSFDALPAAIDKLLNEPALQATARREATRLFFDEPDGRAGKRAADKIISMLPELAP
jgi:hypothetical protein